MGPTTSEKISWNDLRARVVAELRIEALSLEKQNEIIDTVSRALMDRVTLALLKKIPPGEIGALAVSADGAVEDDPEVALELLKKCEQYVPDFWALIEEEMQAGLKAYRELLDKEQA